MIYIHFINYFITFLIFGVQVVGSNTFTSYSPSEKITHKTQLSSSPSKSPASESFLTPVAGYMDYDPKYAASVCHRVNKRTIDINKNVWFKF